MIGDLALRTVLQNHRDDFCFASNGFNCFASFRLRLKPGPQQSSDLLLVEASRSQLFDASDRRLFGFVF